MGRVADEETRLDHAREHGGQDGQGGGIQNHAQVGEAEVAALGGYAEGDEGAEERGDV